ncbi:fibulin-2-like isoform X2 [Culicoides brevitarsis]|uniref:fibulin-2-like isoform X2 n=1 Tax=Culicoides brevitarsis TaxID=469753 RepID=UPI00307C43CC
MDLHTEFIPYTSQHHLFKVFLTKEQFRTYREPFFCVANSLFGKAQMAINVDEIRRHKVTEKKFSYATGRRASFVATDMSKLEKDVKILEGDSLRLSCLEHDFPHRDVVWYKENRPSPNFKSNELIIEKTTKGDQGTYRCYIDSTEQNRFKVTILSERCSPWTSFTPCSVSCGTGYRSRTQKCLKPPNFVCDEINFEVEICQAHHCTKNPEPAFLKQGPELVEWHGNSFKPYKDTEYDKDGPNCAKGFTLDVFRKRCVDVNECKRRENCPKGFRCVNTMGSFNCVPCPKGFLGIKGRCLDINECSIRTHKCSQICVNTHGSYRCACKNGFKLHSDGNFCEYQGFY